MIFPSVEDIKGGTNFTPLAWNMVKDNLVATLEDIEGGQISTPCQGYG